MQAITSTGWLRHCCNLLLNERQYVIARCCVSACHVRKRVPSVQLLKHHRPTGMEAARPHADIRRNSQKTLTTQVEKTENQIIPVLRAMAATSTGAAADLPDLLEGLKDQILQRGVLGAPVQCSSCPRKQRLVSTSTDRTNKVDGLLALSSLRSHPGDQYKRPNPPLWPLPFHDWPMTAPGRAHGCLGGIFTLEGSHDIA